MLLFSYAEGDEGRGFIPSSYAFHKKKLFPHTRKLQKESLVELPSVETPRRLFLFIAK